MSTQLARMVQIMKKLKSGWIRMKMAVRRTGLKGLRIHMASVALNLKMSLPLLMTTVVWREGEREREGELVHAREGGRERGITSRKRRKNENNTNHK